ncbi:MAG: hypothetical protein HDR33_02475 [Treponema sp.]|nr:hypothetical protein [Treponema sp.]
MAAISRIPLKERQPPRKSSTAAEPKKGAHLRVCAFLFLWLADDALDRNADFFIAGRFRQAQVAGLSICPIFSP